MVERTARDLIARAYVDGGHCLDAVRTPDIDRLRKVVHERKNLRGDVEGAAWHLIADWVRHGESGTDWGLLERLHRAVLARWPRLHDRTTA